MGQWRSKRAKKYARLYAWVRANQSRVSAYFAQDEVHRLVLHKIAMDAMEERTINLPDLDPADLALELPDLDPLDTLSDNEE